VTKAEEILTALGGAANIMDLEPCITRLRVEVSDPGRVNEEGLRQAGAVGVVRSGSVVQVVVGPEADQLATEMSSVLRH
jgi:PTS system N-acetylglucosamine-specific IIB component